VNVFLVQRLLIHSPWAKTCWFTESVK